MDGKENPKPPPEGKVGGGGFEANEPPPPSCYLSYSPRSPPRRKSRYTGEKILACSIFCGGTIHPFPTTGSVVLGEGGEEWSVRKSLFILSALLQVACHKRGMKQRNGVRSSPPAEARSPAVVRFSFGSLRAGGNF